MIIIQHRNLLFQTSRAVTDSRSGTEGRNANARRTCTQAYYLNSQGKITLQSLPSTTDDDSGQLGVMATIPVEEAL
jgi:hypothetical protein